MNDEQYKGLSLLLQRLGNALIRLNSDLRDQGERREREHDKVISQTMMTSQQLAVLLAKLEEAAHDIEQVRDNTPVHGVPLPTPRPQSLTGFEVAEHTVNVPKTWIAAGIPIMKWLAIGLVAASGWLYKLIEAHAK